MSANPLLVSLGAYVGVAGWSIPAQLKDRFERGGSHLERYASRFNAVEINSSFYRPHRRSTYERWAASVPAHFRFSIKLPKTITHERRLRDCEELIARFANEVAGLGEKRGPVLVQLPPSLGFEPAAAQRFLTEVSDILGGAIVCEPRHASWFGDEADAVFACQQIARVAADPAVTANGSKPGGCLNLLYYRLHGAPRIYWSDYPAAGIRQHAELIRSRSAAVRELWTIFDNTAAGMAPANALALIQHLA